MILLDDFYSIIHKDHEEGSVKSRISIDGRHKILEGHFPGFPIVPGVCMMQIIREIMEVIKATPLRIVEADNMKFLSVINPEKDSIVDVHIDYTEELECLRINASMFSGAVVFFKIKATLKQ